MDEHPVSRRELDGLGGRVTEVREDFIACRAGKEATSTQLAEALDHQAQNDTRLF